MEDKTDCKHGAGEIVPLINRERCENKATCAEVCPYGVLVVRPVGAAERQALSFKGRLKLWAHGGKQAYADHADRCHGCGLCVAACPEQAITLQRVSETAVGQ